MFPDYHMFDWHAVLYYNFRVLSPKVERAAEIGARQERTRVPSPGLKRGVWFVARRSSCQGDQVPWPK